MVASREAPTPIIAIGRDAFDVAPRIRGELIEGACAVGLLMPSRYVFINRLRFSERVATRRHRVVGILADFVADANLERVDAGENVELGQREAP